MHAIIELADLDERMRHVDKTGDVRIVDLPALIHELEDGRRDTVIPLVRITDGQDDLRLRIVDREFAPVSRAGPIDLTTMAAEDVVPGRFLAAGERQGCRLAGLSRTSNMWWAGPKPRCSSAVLSELVPVRPKPGPRISSAT